MPRIFISYRREESAGQAGRLSDRLCAAFGAPQVFMDVDDIPPGANFVATLRRNVESADVALVLMGPRWLAATDAQGRRRLDDEGDFVRHEVSAALAGGKRVIPVLLNGAGMPGAPELPEPLRPLVHCQAFAFSDARFDRDAAALIEHLGGPPPPSGASRAAGGWRRRSWLAAGGVALVAGAGGWLALRRGSTPPRPEPGPAPAPAAPPPPAADVSGTWEADVFYEWDRRTVREPFSFRFVGGQLVGSAGFLGHPRGIVSGEVKGSTIAFETRSGARINGKEFEYVHRYRGEIAGDAIRMVMQTIGGDQSGVPREFVLRRAPAEGGAGPAPARRPAARTIRTGARSAWR
jgi:hypothetical protein